MANEVIAQTRIGHPSGTTIEHQLVHTGKGKLMHGLECVECHLQHAFDATTEAQDSDRVLAWLAAHECKGFKR